MTETWQGILQHEQDTQKVAEQLAQACSQGAIIFLQGGLGAGKTTFTRCLLRALGFQGTVKSPTYALVEPYQLADLTIFHFDLYRLVDAEELEYMGIRDYFTAGNLCVIEWPERGFGFIPAPDLTVELTVLSQEQRALSITAHSTLGQKALQQTQLQVIQ